MGLAKTKKTTRAAAKAAIAGLAAWLALPVALAQERGIAVIGQAQHPTKPAQSAVNGTFQVQVTLQVSPSLPNGTTISVDTTASTSDSSYTNSVSLTETTTASGGQASITLSMPYTWQVASTSDQVALSVSISGSASSGGATYSDSTSVSATIPLPANGATTPVPISTSI